MATKKIATVSSLFDDLLAEADGTDVNELLEEGAFVDNKENLVGVPLVVTDWTHSAGSGGIVNVQVNAVVASGDRIRFYDAGSGIRLQLEKAGRKLLGLSDDQEIDLTNGPVHVQPKKPLYFPHGLRESSYSFNDKLAGKMVPASTFYLDTNTVV